MNPTNPPDLLKQLRTSNSFNQGKNQRQKKRGNNPRRMPAEYIAESIESGKQSTQNPCRIHTPRCGSRGVFRPRAPVLFFPTQTAYVKVEARRATRAQRERNRSTRPTWQRNGRNARGARQISNYVDSCNGCSDFPNTIAQHEQAST